MKMSDIAKITVINSTDKGATSTPINGLTSNLRLIRKIKVVQVKTEQNIEQGPEKSTSLLFHIFGLDDNKKKILLQTSKGGTLRENYKYAEREFLNQEIPIFEKNKKLFRLTSGKFIIDGPPALTA
jgi:hypothetical protein